MLQAILNLQSHFLSLDNLEVKPEQDGGFAMAAGLLAKQIHCFVQPMCLAGGKLSLGRGESIAVNFYVIEIHYYL